MINEASRVQLEKVDDAKNKITRQSSHASDYHVKVEKWLNNNPSNIKRNVSERKNVPNSRQRIYSDRALIDNEGLNNKKGSNHLSSNDLTSEKMKNVENWLSSVSLNVKNAHPKLRTHSDRENQEAKNNESTKDLKANSALSSSNKEMARSTNSVNSEKNMKEQKQKEPETKYRNTLLDVNEANKNMRIHYNRSTSKEAQIGKPVKIEKQISIHLNDKPVFTSDGIKQQKKLESEVELKEGPPVNATESKGNLEMKNIKIIEKENTLQVTIEKKPSFNAVKRNISIGKNDVVEEKNRNPKNDDTPNEVIKESTKNVVDISRTPSKKSNNNDKENIKRIPSATEKTQDENTVEANQVCLVLNDEEEQIINIITKNNIDEPQNLDIVINHIDVPVKDNEKVSIGQEGVSSTTDKDSKELIKKSIDEKSKDEDEDDNAKKGASTTFNSGKKQILQNWLKDYRRLASKSPLIPKRNKVKRNLGTNDIESLEDKTKADHTAKKLDKNNKNSKKEIEMRKKKSKAYQRKIAILSIAIVILAISILGVTVGLLIKFLVLDKINNNNNNVVQEIIPCLNACSKGYNSTYYNGKCSCFDINECSLPSTHDCTQLGMLCQNTIGSYICNCTVGFSLNLANHSCEDINECNSMDNCDPTDTFGCINTVGSYKCICAGGYEWGDELKACVDTNECFNSNSGTYSNICGQNKTCVNTIGSYECDCAIGYQPILLNNSVTCIEVDECALNSPLYKCPYPYSCKNTEGSYSCCQNNSQICQSCGLQYVSPISRIIGGVNAIAHSWPWMVSIGINFKYSFFVPLLQADFVQWINKTDICGGVLISPLHVLTAAHCVYKLKVQFLDGEVLITPNKDQPTLESIYAVYAGIQDQDYDTLDPNNIYKVEKIYVQEKYDPVSYLNDIALIKLERPIAKTINTDWICIIDSFGKDFNLIYSKVYSIGFGVTAFGSTDTSNTLKQVDLTIYPFSTCNITTLSTTTNPLSQICAGDLSGKKDTCQGDSGSPLMYNSNGIWYVVGLVSYGKACALANYAGIYTNVTYFKNWIESKML